MMLDHSTTPHLDRFRGTWAGDVLTEKQAEVLRRRFGELPEPDSDLHVSGPPGWPPQGGGWGGGSPPAFLAVPDTPAASLFDLPDVEAGK